MVLKANFCFHPILLTTLLGMVLFVSCSKNDPVKPIGNATGPESSTGNSPVSDAPIEYKFIAALLYQDETVSKERVFSYDQGKLVGDYERWLTQFDYNEQGKILAQSICSAQNIADEDPADYECAQFLEMRTHGYTQGLLNSYKEEKLDENQTVIFSSIVTLIQDDMGNVFSEVYDASDGNIEDHSYNYNDQGNLLSHRIKYIAQNTSIAFTFEFDDNINPLYPLWKDFGYYLGISSDETLLTPVFLKHNITRIFRNNVLELEVDYTYDGKGYPLTAFFTRHLAGGAIKKGGITYAYKN